MLHKGASYNNKYIIIFTIRQCFIVHNQLKTVNRKRKNTNNAHTGLAHIIEKQNDRDNTAVKGAY